MGNDETQPNNNLSGLIRARRHELGLSVKNVSAAAGMTPFTWNWLERAASPRLPQPHVLAGIGRALNVPVIALLKAAGYEVEAP